jgi:nucleoid-associated protein YgaU
VASTIGIKIANGEFYPIVKENSSVKKRLILTTVHDKQRSVQIDLYKSFTNTMADALYIGSLVVENIKPRSKGEPSIEMVISSTESGEIVAEAIDLDSSAQGEHHYLNVSLKSLDEDNREYEIPDFELEQNESPPTGLYEKAKVIHEKEAKRFPWLVVVCAGLVLVAVCIAVWLLVFRGRLPLGGGNERASSRPSAEAQPASPPPAPPASPTPPPPQVRQTPPAQSTPPSSAAQTPPPPPPVIQAPVVPPPAAPPASRQRPAPPVASYRVPTTIPREGAPYRIRWGDTLWDISEAFYRNPWLYPRIARFNNIRNPDLIISGRTIRIPPRN